MHVLKKKIKRLLLPNYQIESIYLYSLLRTVVTLLINKERFELSSFQNNTVDYTDCEILRATRVRRDLNSKLSGLGKHWDSTREKLRFDTDVVVRQKLSKATLVEIVSTADTSKVCWACFVKTSSCFYVRTSLKLMLRQKFLGTRSRRRAAD